MKAKGNGPAFVIQTYEDRLNNNNNTNKSVQKLSDETPAISNGVAEEIKRLTLSKTNSVSSTPPPPPPPPQMNGSLSSSTLSSPSSSSPSTRSNTLKSTKTKPKAPPVPVKYSVLSYEQQNCFQKSATFNGYNSPQVTQPPPCPTPDYDTLSLASTTSNNPVVLKSSPSQKLNNDTAELESLESFRLNNPSNVKPTPPNTYFQKRNLTSTLSNQSTNSNTSTIRRSRPISVTIGEYPSSRRQPGKLDFLQNGHSVSNLKKDESLGSRLTSELTQTLNRSNLKKRTESMENLLGDSPNPSQIKTERNGAVRISLSNLSKSFAKSTSDLTEDFYDHYDILPNRRNNRVTINVNLTKTESPTSILKNSSPDCQNSPAHKTLTAQKSITFRE